MNLNHVVGEAFRDQSLAETLSGPVTALAGVDAAGSAALSAELKITTVESLAKNILFRFAQAMVVMGGVKNDAVHGDWADRPLRDVLDEPPTVVKYISPAAADALQTAFGITTIREMGTNLAFRRAQALLALAEGA